MLIAQLTDTHVMRAGVSRRFMGDTAGHVARAVDWIAALPQAPDAVVVTGDLTDGADPAEYARLLDILTRLRQPVYVVPGNHDRGARLREAFAAHGYLPPQGRLNYVVDRHAVRLVGIDSTEAGRAGGSVDAATLEWLDQTLGATQRPTVLCLHHPPFRTGMHYMDWFGFTGMHELRALILKHGQVRLVIGGHVHRAFSTSLGGARLWTSLSTAPQIVPEIFERHPFRLRFEPPGLSLHSWDATSQSFTSRLYAAAKTGGYAEAPNAVSSPDSS